MYVSRQRRFDRGGSLELFSFLKLPSLPIFRSSDPHAGCPLGLTALTDKEGFVQCDPQSGDAGILAASHIR